MLAARPDLRRHGDADTHPGLRGYPPDRRTVADVNDKAATPLSHQMTSVICFSDLQLVIVAIESKYCVATTPGSWAV